MINCHYCGVGNKEDEGSCVRCGAPLSTDKAHFLVTSSDYGTCMCGHKIEDKIVEYKIQAFCHKCYNFFDAEFRGEYYCDKVYPTGQMTHFYKTVGLECPHCGTIFQGHEFYHGIHAEHGNDYLIEHAKRAHALV